MHYRGAVYNRRRYRLKLYREDPTCALCSQPIATFEESNLDHIIPRIHGGHTTKDNLQLAHIKCNYRKGHEL